MRFSQRIGKSPVEKAIQIESMDVELKNTLWSLVTAFYWDQFNRQKYGISGRSDLIKGSNLGPLFISLWLYYYKEPIDTIPELFYDALPGIRSYFFNARWHEVYDFIEFCAEYGLEDQQEGFTQACNNFMSRENAGYRFVDCKIVEISSSDEVVEIESAIENASPFYGVRQHLSAAITLLSDKESPDFRNSIKESISAVEALCKKVGNDDKATLGSALKLLERKGVMHPALKSAFSSLYGYTNDADGIRHSLIEESRLTKADARFMLISCSAFINYVIANT